MADNQEQDLLRNLEKLSNPVKIAQAKKNLRTLSKIAQDLNKIEETTGPKVESLIKAVEAFSDPKRMKVAEQSVKKFSNLSNQSDKARSSFLSKVMNQPAGGSAGGSATPPTSSGSFKRVKERINILGDQNAHILTTTITQQSGSVVNKIINKRVVDKDKINEKITKMYAKVMTEGSKNGKGNGAIVAPVGVQMQAGNGIENLTTALKNLGNTKEVKLAIKNVKRISKNIEHFDNIGGIQELDGITAAVDGLSDGSKLTNAVQNVKYLGDNIHHFEKVGGIDTLSGIAATVDNLGDMSKAKMALKNIAMLGKHIETIHNLKGIEELEGISEVVDNFTDKDKIIMATKNIGILSKHVEKFISFRGSDELVKIGGVVQQFSNKKRLKTVLQNIKRIGANIMLFQRIKGIEALDKIGNVVKNLSSKNQIKNFVNNLKRLAKHTEKFKKLALTDSLKNVAKFVDSLSSSSNVKSAIKSIRKIVSNIVIFKRIGGAESLDGISSAVDGLSNVKRTKNAIKSIKKLGKAAQWFENLGNVGGFKMLKEFAISIDGLSNRWKTKRAIRNLRFLTKQTDVMGKMNTLGDLGNITGAVEFLASPLQVAKAIISVKMISKTIGTFKKLEGIDDLTNLSDAIEALSNPIDVIKAIGSVMILQKTIGNFKKLEGLTDLSAIGDAVDDLSSPIQVIKTILNVKMLGKVLGDFDKLKGAENLTNIGEAVSNLSNPIHVLGAILSVKILTKHIEKFRKLEGIQELTGLVAMIDKLSDFRKTKRVIKNLKNIEKNKHLFDGVSGGQSFGGKIRSGLLKMTGLGSPKLPAFAEGGIVTKPMLAEVGERGAEAIMPLSKISRLIKESVEEIFIKFGLHRQERDTEAVRIQQEKLEGQNKTIITSNDRIETELNQMGGVGKKQMTAQKGAKFGKGSSFDPKKVSLSVGILGLLAGLWNWLKGLNLKQMFEGIFSKLKAFKAFAIEQFAKVIAHLKPLGEQLLKAGKYIWKQIDGWIIKPLRNIGSFIWGKISAIIKKTPLGKFINAGKEMGGKMLDKGKEIYNVGKNIVNSGASKVSNAASKTMNFFKQGANALTGGGGGKIPGNVADGAGGGFGAATKMLKSKGGVTTLLKKGLKTLGKGILKLPLIDMLFVGNAELNRRKMLEVGASPRQAMMTTIVPEIGESIGSWIPMILGTALSGVVGVGTGGIGAIPTFLITAAVSMISGKLARYFVEQIAGSIVDVVPGVEPDETFFADVSDPSNPFAKLYQSSGGNYSVDDVKKAHSEVNPSVLAQASKKIGSLFSNAGGMAKDVKKFVGEQVGVETSGSGRSPSDSNLKDRFMQGLTGKGSGNVNTVKKKAQNLRTGSAASMKAKLEGQDTGIAGTAPTVVVQGGSNEGSKTTIPQDAPVILQSADTNHATTEYNKSATGT